MLITAALLALLAGDGPDASTMRSGNEVLASCTASSLGEDVVCLAWVSGLAGGVDAAQAIAKTCVVGFPAGSNNGQYRDIIVSYLKNHARQRHLPARVLGAVALQQAFPCPAAQ